MVSGLWQKNSQIQSLDSSDPIRCWSLNSLQTYFGILCSSHDSQWFLPLIVSWSFKVKRTCVGQIFHLLQRKATSLVPSCSFFFLSSLASSCSFSSLATQGYTAPETITRDRSYRCHGTCSSWIASRFACSFSSSFSMRPSACSRLSRFWKTNSQCIMHLLEKHLSHRQAVGTFSWASRADDNSATAFRCASRASVNSRLNSENSTTPGVRYKAQGMTICHSSKKWWLCLRLWILWSTAQS